VSENATRTTGWPPHRVTGVDVWPFRIHEGQPQFLLMHRVEGEDPPFWQGVSGWIEADELPHVTAVRELGEETGLDPLAVFGIDAIFDLYKPGRGTVEVIVPFAVEVGDGADPILSDEHDDWRWASLAEALTSVPYEPQRAALRRFEADVVERPDMAHLYRIGPPFEGNEKSR
jgi:8-oxo-dGTP pyrophosphatase MutT (NUDIX family)